MKNEYDDIINLPHHVSSKRPRMPMTARAAQFSPFAALTGHGAAISETARETSRRVELEEDVKADLDAKQRLLAQRMEEHPQITVTWFQPDGKKAGGSYLVTEGRLKKVDEAERFLLLMDGTRIPLDDVTDIESQLFSGLFQEG